MAAEVVTKVEGRSKAEAGETDSGLASEEEEEAVVQLSKEEDQPVELDVVWGNVVKFIILHSLALYGLTLLPSISAASWVFLFLTYQFSGAGITAGAHRLWAHKSYKVCSSKK
jgi:stearoyl-CoA desaturase (delta-9 desaturase)